MEDSQDWTIDTCVLYQACCVDWDAVEFLNGVRRQNHRVTLDHDRSIYREYSRCIRKTQRDRPNGAEMVGRWLKYVIDRLATWYSGRLPRRHQDRLSRLGFDRSDWPFVAVCHRSVRKRLVTEDSDYEDVALKSYLRDSMGVRVLTIQDALGELQGF